MIKHTTVACLLLAASLPGAMAQDNEPKEAPAPAAPAAVEEAAPPAPEEVLKTASYLIGRNIGETILADDLGLDVEILVSALREALAGKESTVSDEDSQKTMQAFQAMMEEKMMAKAEEQKKKNIAEGATYLEENKKREGVKVTESGLQYEVLKEGTGEKPSASDVVSVHYHGTLLDGTVFDSSVERDQPAQFQVGGVIPGWTEALQMMPKGSKWRIVIPSELGYGERGAGRDIGPHATLVFEVELLDIQKPNAIPSNPLEIPENP